LPINVAHLPDLVCPILLIVLDDADCINPNISKPQAFSCLDGLQHGLGKLFCIKLPKSRSKVFVDGHAKLLAAPTIR
jgi:hypothetical protein